MNTYIAYCGLDCETCEARLATINHDEALRKRVAKEWSELNGANITGAYTNNEQYRYTANIYAGEGLTLTVVLNGENTVDDSSVFVGICSDGPALTLKGGGRLTAKGSSL